MMDSQPPNYSESQLQNEEKALSQLQQPPAPPYTPPTFIQQGQTMMQPVEQVAMQPYQHGPMVAIVSRQLKLPREFQPNDYLIVTLIVIIVCAVLNLTSLLFSIPAIICSVLAFLRRSAGLYAHAKYLGLAALILDMICVMWTVAITAVGIGVLFACVSGVGTVCAA